MRVKEAGVCGVYPGGVRLQGSQVVLQGQTAAVVQHGLHPSQVSLHQLLLLAGCLLLQGLHHGLEVLQTKKKIINIHKRVDALSRLAQRSSFNFYLKKRKG